MSNTTSKILSDKFGTDVTIEKIDLGLFNRVILHNVKVKDKKGEDLLNARRLSARIKMRSIVKSPFTIRTLEFYNANINLYKENKNDEYNFKFILDSLSTKDGKSNSPLDLRIKSIIISKSAVEHNIRYAAMQKGFDVNHISIKDMDASIGIQITKGDNFNIRIRNLALKEKSGLNLQKSYILSDISKNKCNIPILQIETGKSKINAHSIELAFCDKNIQKGKGVIENTNINLCDLNPFFQKQKFPDRTYTLNSDFTINEGIVTSRDISINRGKEADISVYALYKNQKNFTVQIKKLNLSEKETTSLSQIFTKDTTLSKYIEKTGDLSLEALIKNDRGKLYVHGSLNTQVGSLKYSGKILENGSFEAFTSSDNILLGNLLSKQNLLGSVAFQAECKGTAKNKFVLNSAIRQIEINKYNYKNINLSLTSDKNLNSFTLNANDPNAKLNLTGKVVPVAAKKQIIINSDIENISPYLIGLTSKYPDTKISLQANADLLSSNIDDAIGNISIKNVDFIHPDSIFTLKEVNLEATPLNKGRRVAVNGDFGKAEISGVFNFNTLFPDLMNIIRPKASDNEKPHYTEQPKIKKSGRTSHLYNGNNFSFHANIGDLELLNQLLGVKVKVSGNNYLSGYIDSHKNNLLVEGRLPKLQWGEQSLSDLSLYCKGNDSILRSNIHFSKDLKSGKANVEVESRREERAINCNIIWKGGGEHNYSGNVSQNITFPNDDASIINFNITPSHIIIEDTLWTIPPALLSYSKGCLQINDFNLKHGSKQLSLNGTVSKLKSDSLQLKLSGIRINDILDMVAFDDVEFGGIATGNVNVSDVFGTPAVNADLNVENFEFNNAPMGNMNLIGTWNNEMKQIDLKAFIEESQGTTDITGFVNTGQNTIDLRFDANNTNAMFLNKFMPDAVQFEQGRTTGKLRLHGKLNAMNLEGTQVISNIIADIEPLCTRYVIDGDTINFRTDVIEFKGLDIVDRYGNHAKMQGQVNHKALHHFSYDFNIAANKFLAYDCPRSSEYSFWGTAYANGNIHIYGFPGQFYTEASVQPAENTVFTYNAARPDDPEHTQMLTYRNADSRYTTDDSKKQDFNTVIKKEEKGTDIRLNFTFDLTPASEIRVIMNEEAGNVISIRGTGNIHAMYYNKGSFEMFGNYDILRGTYKMNLQDLIHKDFYFKSGGNITFNGDPFAGDLNLQAVYTVPSVSLSDLMADGNLRDNSVKVDCIMNFSGSVGQPIVKFDLDIPSVSSDEQQMVRSLIATPEDMNMQIVYLLSFGRFYTYNYASQTVSTSQSQSSLAMNSFLSNTLSSNLNSLLSNVLEESKWTFGTNVATGNEGWNDMDVEGLFTGHLLNNRLILNGNLGYRDRTAYNSNFVGDFSVLYLLNKRGTIQLKAYSESNDRYFTKSTLTTQGGGIVFKRNFTKLKDLFRSSKK